jgi:hypothetical protein
MLFELGARVRVVSQDTMEDNPYYDDDEHDHSIPSEGASGILLQEAGANGGLVLVYWDKDVGGFFGWGGGTSDDNLLLSTGNRLVSFGSFYWVPKYSLEIVGTSTPKVKFRDKLPNEAEMNYKICKKVNEMDNREREGKDALPKHSRN